MSINEINFIQKELFLNVVFRHEFDIFICIIGFNILSNDAIIKKKQEN